MKQPNKLLGHCLVLCALLLSGCAQTQPQTQTAPGFANTPAMAPFPGNYPSYAWGTAQLKENFENVEVAQWVPGLFREQRTWRLIAPTTRHTAQIIGLGQYLPFSVRWKLKDGREFMLENIDTAAIMREYFKSNSIRLPWQEEGRPRAPLGDMDPVLAHEIVNETLRIKWVVRKNNTPLDKRFLPNGAATEWDISRSEVFVTNIPGKPTSGIDFNTRMEFSDEKGARK